MHDIYDFSVKRMQSWLEARDEPPYRAHQILAAVWKTELTDFQHARTLPKTLRSKLQDHFLIPEPLTPTGTSSSPDGTLKAVFTFPDRTRVECVAIPKANRLTFCLSTQVGCAMGCTFCATAGLGFIRNLSAAEIIAQIRGLSARVGKKPSNLVLMGMGEPLLNLEAVRMALDILTHPQTWNLSPRKIMVSTCGWIPGIEAITREPLPAKLALSLNAVHDELRNQLMPVNRRYPLAPLLQALHAYVQNTDETVSIEYVLLGGVNDQPNDARILARLLRNLNAKVNLIPLNPHSHTHYHPPTAQAIAAFRQELRAARILTTLRTSRGEEIGAACGQLAGLDMRKAA